jgi:hypothetical protein
MEGAAQVSLLMRPLASWPIRAREARTRGLSGLALVAGLGACLLAACGGLQGDATKTRKVRVFDLRPGECLVAPRANPNFRVASVRVVSCRSPHSEEVYCVLPYSTTLPQVRPACPARPAHFVGLPNQDYPGDRALESFANAICLDEFQAYVGTSYTHSSLYYTYLYPSPRSWDSPSLRDRSITCVLLSLGKPLTRSAKGSRL